MGKYQGLNKIITQDKEDLEFKPAALYLKTDLASHPACGGGVG